MPALLKYERKALKRSEAWLSNPDKNEAVISLPDGLDRIGLGARVAKLAVDNGDKVLWISRNSIEASNAAVGALHSLGCDVGLERSGSKLGPTNTVCVTIARLGGTIDFSPDVIVIDGAEGRETGTMRALLDRFSLLSKPPKIVNLVSEPYTSDLSKPLNMGTVLARVNMQQSIEAKDLVPPRNAKYTLGVDGLDLATAVRNGEKCTKNLTKLMMSDNTRAKCVENIVDEFVARTDPNSLDYIPNFKGVVYACNPEHGKKLTEELSAEFLRRRLLSPSSPLVNVAEIYAGTSAKERARIQEDYRLGTAPYMKFAARKYPSESLHTFASDPTRIICPHQILVNNTCLVDFREPSTKYVSILSPTRGIAFYLEKLAAGMGVFPGKDCFVISDPVDLKKVELMRRDFEWPTSKDGAALRALKLGVPGRKNKDVSIAEIGLSWFRLKSEVDAGVDPSKMATINCNPSGVNLNGADLYKLLKPLNFDDSGGVKVDVADYLARVKMLDNVLAGDTSPTDPEGVCQLCDALNIYNIRGLDNPIDRLYAQFRAVGWESYPHLKFPKPKASVRASTVTPSSSASSLAAVNVESILNTSALQNSVTGMTKGMWDVQDISSFCEQHSVTGSNDVMIWSKPLGLSQTIDPITHEPVRMNLEPSGYPDDFCFIDNGANPKTYFVRAKSGYIYEFRVGTKLVGGKTQAGFFPGSGSMPSLKAVSAVPYARSSNRPHISATDAQLPRAAKYFKMSEQELKAAKVSSMVASAAISHEESEDFRAFFPNGKSALENIKLRLIELGELERTYGLTET